MSRSRLRSGFGLAALLAAGAAAGQPAAEARRLLDQGQVVPAIEPLSEIFAADPESAEGRRLLWELARRADPRPEVLDALGAAADGLGTEGWVAAGVLLRRGLRPLDALEAFDRAARVRPSGDSLADLEAGRLLAELRSHELALRRFERHPEDPAAIHGRAVVLARIRRTEEAFALAGALLRADPMNPGVVLLQSELLDSVGRGSEALDALRTLAERAGPASAAGFRLARILVKLGEWEEALPILEAVLAATPASADAWLALGRAHENAGQREEATGAFRRALEEDPALNEARFALAQVLVRAGEREAAAPLFAEFERRKAVADESGRLLGEAELRPGDYRRIEAFVTHALANGDFGLALRGAQRFLVEFPEHPARHLLLARVFREGGSRADAERVLRRGLERFAGDDAAVRRFEAGLQAIGVR